MLGALEIVYLMAIHGTDQEVRQGQVLGSHCIGEWPNGWMRTDGKFVFSWLSRKKGSHFRGMREDSPISISLVGGQRSHQDSQDGSQ